MPAGSLYGPVLPGPVLRSQATEEERPAWARGLEEPTAVEKAQLQAVGGAPVVSAAEGLGDPRALATAQSSADLRSSAGTEATATTRSPKAAQVPAATQVFTTTQAATAPEAPVEREANATATTSGHVEAIVDINLVLKQELAD